MLPIGNTLLILTATILISLQLLCALPSQATDEGFEQSREIASRATTSTALWPLPPRGPKAKPNKKVVLIAEDLRNGGILGVGQGVKEAVAAIGWEISVLDIGTNDEKRPEIFQAALDMKPDGIILGSSDSTANQQFLTPFKEANIPIVGWHTSPFPGPVEGTPIAVNITTDSLEVARTAAHYVIADSMGKASVVIFTDSRFKIALAKASAMAEIIRSCQGCTLLEVQDVALDKTSQLMLGVTTTLLNKYGDQWEYSLGINDLYFDYAITPLVMNGHSPSGKPFNISAGDGSPSAFLRIQNKSYQKATVPEPLFFHGWQMIDELNRLFHKLPPSGYITPPHIVTQQNIGVKTERMNFFDPQNDYRRHYLTNWGRTSQNEDY